MLNEKGMPLKTKKGQTITIDKYPHLEDYGLFGEELPVHKKEKPEPPPLSYTIDPSGMPIPVDPKSDSEEMFGGVTFDPGMSDK